MKVDVKPSPKLNPNQQTNPPNPPNQSNQSDQDVITLLTSLLQKVEDTRKQLQANLYPHPQNPQLQQNNLSNLSNDGEFIVKANMKASVIAVRVEQILMTKKKIILSALGFAIPIQLDSVILIKKDLERYGVKINIGFELFEREVVGLDGKHKTITGLRTIVSI